MTLQIAVADLFTSDPYIVVYADGKNIGQTKTCRSTCSPVWNEEISVVLFHKGSVVLKIYDQDITTSEFLGIVELDLVALPKRKEDAQQVVLPIQQSTSKYKAKGTVTLTAYVVVGYYFPLEL